MAQPQEIELKLEVPADAINALHRHALLQRTKPKKAQRLRSVYFDTAKQTLHKKGLALRVRRIGGRYVQTIKQQSGRSVGFFQRAEWECDIGSRTPDLNAARGTALQPLLGRKLKRDLRPVFETRVERRVYPIHAGRNEIELTLDEGKVAAGRKSSPLCEVELELKHGEPKQLFVIARRLGETLPLAPASKSKDAQGYDLIAHEEIGPIKSQPVALSPDMDWGTAFKLVARSCLYQIVANAPALRRGDAEAVHQMRVGLRRLRAAMSLFKNVLAGRQTEAVKAELKWLTGELGPARELDVFMKRVVKASRPNGADRRGNAPGMGAVIADFHKRRADAMKRAAQAVDSARFRRLAVDTTAWIETGDWTHRKDVFNSDREDYRASDAAADELRRRWKKIRKRGAHLAELEPGRRHKLRIAAKKLRYAIEFFGGAFPGKKAKARRETFIDRLKAMQDALGELNDIAVHEQLARQEIAPRDGKRRGRARQAFAAGRLSGQESARAAAVMHDAERAYARFAKAKVFWK
jgi:triphosphatase